MGDIEVETTHGRWAGLFADKGARLADAGVAGMAATRAATSGDGRVRRALPAAATSTPNEAKLRARSRFSFPLSQQAPTMAVAESTALEALNESFNSSMITTNSKDNSQNQR